MARNHFLAACVVVVMASQTALAYAAQITNPFKFVEEWVEEFSNEVRRAGQKQVIAAAQPNDPFGPKEKEAQTARLKQLGIVYRDWLDQVCELSDQQKMAFEEISNRLSETVASPVDDRQQQVFRYLPDSSPINFHSKTGPADNFLKALGNELTKNNVLNDEQRLLLTAALEQRASRQHEAYCGELINLLDDQLFFTPDQRQAISTRIIARRPLRTHALYAFQNYSYYIPYEPIKDQLTLFQGQLSSVQELRLDDLKEVTASTHMSFNGNDGVDQWYKAVDEEMVRQKQKIRTAIAVRVAFYQVQNQLSEDQHRMLDVAGKGTLQRILNQWREQTIQTLQQYEQMQMQNNQNFGFGLQYPDIQNLEADPVWSHTLDKLKLKTASHTRDQLARQADVEYLLTLADDELWLTPAQLASLRELIDDKVKSSDRNGMNRYYYYSKDLLRMARVVHLIDQAEVQPILTEAQMTAWLSIKNYFKLQNTYITMQTRHGDMQIGVLK